LQTLLFAIKETDNKLTQKLISKLLDECFTVRNEAQDELEKCEDKSSTPEVKNILSVFEDAAAVRLLEAAIINASPKKFTQIYAKCFVNHLAVLSQHRLANYSVQKLLDCCKEKTEFEGMFSELEEHLEEILKSHNTGVILSLAQACKRHSTKQGSFQRILMRTLHCLEPKERQGLLCPLTLSLATYEEQANSNKLVIQLNGSLILQTLLNFNKPIQAVSSLLDMNTGDLKSVLTDQKGCHVMDAFMKSEFVGEKSRDKIIKKLQVSVNSCTLLFLSKYTSFLLPWMPVSCSTLQREFHPANA
jgi:Pumilio-family RNA binding repeat.